MKTNRYEDIDIFYNKAVMFLEKDEAVNNLALGILKNLKKNKHSYGKSDPFLAIVENDENIKLVMLMTPPYNLQIIGCRSKDVLISAINYLFSNNIEIPGIIGIKTLCDDFVDIWKEQTQMIPEVSMDQRIYKLERVNELPESSGSFKIADKENSEILVNWLVEFNEYIGENSDRERAEKNIRNFIDKKRAFLWVDEVPVTMVLAGRETKNGITVSGVYTPEKFRRKGYATSCVAETSRFLLEEGYKYCTLYTDLSNPTSNSIYQKIGYRPIADSVMYGFKTGENS